MWTDDEMAQYRVRIMYVKLFWLAKFVVSYVSFSKDITIILINSINFKDELHYHLDFHSSVCNKGYWNLSNIFVEGRIFHQFFFHIST